MREVLGIPLRMPPFYYLFKVTHAGPLPTALDTSRQFTLAEVCTFGSKVGKYLGVPTHHFGQHHDVSIPIRLDQNPFRMLDRLCHATTALPNKCYALHTFFAAPWFVHFYRPPPFTAPTPGLFSISQLPHIYTYTCIVLRGAGAVSAAATGTNHVPRCGADPDQ